MAVRDAHFPFRNERVSPGGSSALFTSSQEFQEDKICAKGTHLCRLRYFGMNEWRHGSVDICHLQIFRSMNVLAENSIPLTHSPGSISVRTFS